MKNTPNGGLNRRKFLSGLGTLLSTGALGVSTAVAEVLGEGFIENENARRDIILLLNGGLYRGMSTPTDKKILQKEVLKTRFTLETINNRLGILYDANELKYFSLSDGPYIYDYIIRQKSKLIQVNDKGVQAEIVGGDFENNIRTELIPILEEFASKSQGNPDNPLTSTDDRGVFHSFYGKPKDVPNPNNPKHFYGGIDGENLPNSYINRYLFENYVKSGQISSVLQTNSSIYIYTNKIEGKNFIAVYDASGELKVLSFVSIGTENHPTELPHIITKNTDDKSLLQMNKISVQANGSSMWGAVHIKGGIYFHSSALGIDGKPKSHGCVRTPLLYLYGLHQILKNAPQGTNIQMFFNNLY